MKNNKITNNFLKKIVGPDNLDLVKQIIKQIESKVKTSKEIQKKN